MTARVSPEPSRAGGVLEWHELRAAVCQYSPPRNPPSQHWFRDDCSLSYCADCAEARAAWLLMLEPAKTLAENQFDIPNVADAETALKWWIDAVDGMIDGGSWYSAEGDTSASCDLCGRTLHYWLTEYGIDEEIAYHASPESGFGHVAETAYGIDRLFECDDDRQAEVRAIAEAFLAYAAAQPPERNTRSYVGDTA